MVEKMRDSRVSGVLVGRGALRNPWIFEQAAAVARGETPREIAPAERGAFLLEYIELLLRERTGEARGFRHVAPGAADAPARGHDRWGVNKLRALNSWYTKGLDNGSHLRTAINSNNPDDTKGMRKREEPISQSIRAARETVNVG
mgnify:CR=1 FL=1